MRALLDVNVLIALFDADHIFHRRAHDWWNANAEKGWASCPLTENGFVRIMSHAGYSGKIRLSPPDLIARLDEFAATSDHVFWPDDATLRDQAVFAAERLHSSRQITDTYLLGLANRHNGRLATFDDGVDISTVPGAPPQALCVIP
jgi:hypothetical protein